jgi:predicted amidophosphoribosyltransferase
MAGPWDVLGPEQRSLRIRAHLADNHVACSACGYDLFGLDADACPECGAALDHVRFSFLAPEPDDNYQSRRLREYLATNRGACPACRREIDRVDGRDCPHCGERLEVWMLVPRGLPWRKKGDWNWVVVITVLYLVLAAIAGAIGFLGRL